MKSLPTVDKNTPKDQVRRVQALLVAAQVRLPGSTDAHGAFDGVWGDETGKAVKKELGTTSVGPREWRFLLGV